LISKDTLYKEESCIIESGILSGTGINRNQGQSPTIIMGKGRCRWRVVNVSFLSKNSMSGLLIFGEVISDIIEE
jgi:hypothetical protein